MFKLKCDCCGYWFASEAYPQFADDWLCDLCFVDERYDAYKAGANREGYKLVPLETTEKMLDAARCRQWDDLSSPFEDMDMLKYKAMIGAVDE